jgi:hypothetical protein
LCFSEQRVVCTALLLWHGSCGALASASTHSKGVLAAADSAVLWTYRGGKQSALAAASSVKPGELQVDQLFPSVTAALLLRLCISNGCNFPVPFTANSFAKEQPWSAVLCHDNTSTLMKGKCHACLLTSDMLQ